MDADDSYGNSSRDTRDDTREGDMSYYHGHLTGGNSPLSSKSNSLHQRRDIARANQESHEPRRVLESPTCSKFQKLFGAFTKLNDQHRVKNVDASQHVLDTYHDSFLYGKVPFTVTIRAALRGGYFGHFWHFFEFFFAIASGVLYVYSTYDSVTTDNWVTRSQNYVSVFFVCDYILRVYSESARLNYIFSVWGLIDLLSALPIIFLFKSSIHGGKILRLLQFLRVIRIISLMSKLGVAGSTVAQQILLLVVSTFGAVFLVAGLIQFVEYSGAPADKRDGCPSEGCINFWDAFYFTIVTISTVGYGDITMKTQLGQLVAMCTIIGALTILPIQIGRITFLASRRPYGGSFSGRKVIDSRYLIISGSISFQSVQECLAEFFNPTHCEDLEVYPLRVTILAPFGPSFELKQLVSLYNGLVEFIEGSPIRQSDLERVAANRAAAFFLLANKEADDQAVEDAAQIVKALAVHRYCKNQVRIIVEVLQPETQDSAVWDETNSSAIEVFCPIKLHYKMIGRREDDTWPNPEYKALEIASCIVKGLYTFITNLFTSEIKIQPMPKKFFMSEYFHSFDNEVYPVIFPKACHGMLFEEVVEFVFDNFDVLLFGLDVEVVHSRTDDRTRKVLLYPKGHVIQADNVGLVICWDLRSAYAISQYGDEHMMKKSKKWRKRKDQSTLDIKKYRTGPIDMSELEIDEDKRDRDDQDLPHSNNFHAKSLESRMRYAISGRYNGFDDDNALELGYLKDRSIPEDNDGSFSSHSSAADGAYPKGMSLEEATERLLAWPPLPAHSLPHVSVLERRSDVILKNLQERTVAVAELKAPHILVCCQNNWPQLIYYFIKELRKGSDQNPPVVILHPDDPTAKQWGTVGIFENVFFLKGSPIFELDLMRGGVLQAEKVVLLGTQDEPVDVSGEGVEGTKRRATSTQRSDVDSIVISATVERLVGKERADVLIVDMQHTFSFYYLRPKFEIRKDQVQKEDYQRNRDALIHFGPPFMEGKAVSLSLLGFVLRSSFYNRNTVSIVEQFVEGGYVVHQGASTGEHQRVLNQIPVPPEYANREYGELFLGLLHDQGVLPLGLYRARGTLGAPTGYVFTNPPKDSIVNPADLVYILS